MRNLLKAGSNRTEDSSAALFWASYHLDVVQALKEVEADINAQGVYGLNVLDRTIKESCVLSLSITAFPRSRS